MSDNEFKELEQKLERDDPTFRFKFLSENNVSYFIAAQKKRPQSLIWIELINMNFTGEKFNAGKLKNDNERKLLYENALHYLSKSLIILENGNYPDNNDSIKRVYNTYKGMIKEDIAFAAMGAGEFDKAKQMANELLKNNSDTFSLNYGNTIHKSNTTLGRVALRENNLEKAKEYLIKSVAGITSPQLSSFGPSYILAKELLELGEKDIVLQYLDLVANIWANPERVETSDTRRMAANQRKIALLNTWKKGIKSGEIPDNPAWK